jgi:Tfp pilus assembly protein PilP
MAPHFTIVLLLLVACWNSADALLKNTVTQCKRMRA